MVGGCHGFLVVFSGFLRVFPGIMFESDMSFGRNWDAGQPWHAEEWKA
jgi:hypothetical protein